MSDQESPLSDKFCDLVMKGGITSGVVYPKAIDELAHEYMFKNIGGTSAGAIAASLTAAAEYQRRSNGSMSGFIQLAKLPEELGATTSERNQSLLLSLFQPHPSTKRLFNVLISALNSSSTYGRIGSIFLGFLRNYWMATIIGFVVSAAIWKIAFSLIATGLSLFVTMIVFIAYFLYRDITQKMVANNYGLCSGMTMNKQEALTPWLHRKIQEAAGRNLDDAPLTFGDLWKAPGFPPAWLMLPKQSIVRSINLVMYTTNLSHGRPYVLPFDDPTSQLYFRENELAKYLPNSVMDWIKSHAKPYAPRPGREKFDPSLATGAGLFELPPPENFPILLAARMSLSFPLLFSTIPLWAIDYDTDYKSGKRGFQRCQFSDGGISSNFPMHLFDGLIPLWPTFGIQLEPKLRSRTNMVYLPQSYDEGYGERWERFDENQNSSSRFGGFLAAIVNTMQNWNDTALSRMPGVRDRVVRVRLNKNEGGMNLNMPNDLIDAVSVRGQDAAKSLIERFIPKASAISTEGWDEQRWVRLRVLIRMFEKQLPPIKIASNPNVPHAKDFETMINDALVNTPPGYSQPLSVAEADALKDIISCMINFSDDVRVQANQFHFQPIPEPELRVRPPL